MHNFHHTDGLDIALLDGLSLEDIDRFLALATHRSFQNDEVIIAEGDPGHALFIVLNGWVRVEKATIEQTQELLTSLGPGECFGELSLVDREPRSATVRAVGKTGVYALESNDTDRPCLLENLTTPAEAIGRDLFEVVFHLGEGVRQKLHLQRRLHHQRNRTWFRAGHLPQDCGEPQRHH